MKYIIVSALNTIILEDVVKSYLKKGWNPQGGVAYIEKSREVVQAMVKE